MLPPLNAFLERQEFRVLVACVVCVTRHSSPESQGSTRFQHFVSLLPEKLLHGG